MTGPEDFPATDVRNWQQSTVDKAFAELNKAYESREFYIILLKVDQRLDPLRSDPRFANLVRRVGLPQ